MQDIGTTEGLAQEKNITAKLQKNEAQVEQLYKQWNNKWKETHKIMEVIRYVCIDQYFLKLYMCRA